MWGMTRILIEITCIHAIFMGTYDLHGDILIFLDSMRMLGDDPLCSGSSLSPLVSRRILFKSSGEP